MHNNFQQILSSLARTPDALKGLLQNLPASLTSLNEGENTWSSFDVVNHLIDGERVNWMPRAKTILQFGESKTFEPFDREAHLKAGRDKTLDQLLIEFGQLRAENLKELSGLNLQQEQLNLRGQHPAFGTVTLSQLLAAWATHDLTHLHQISRILAHQYREAVGPWSAYLGVLKCSGHGSD